MVSQWVINGVLIILNENGPVNGTEMLLTVHYFCKKWKINGQRNGNKK